MVAKYGSSIAKRNCRIEPPLGIPADFLPSLLLRSLMAVTIPACSVPLQAAFQHVGRMQHSGVTALQIASAVAPMCC